MFLLPLLCTYYDIVYFRLNYKLGFLIYTYNAFEIKSVSYCDFLNIILINNWGDLKSLATEMIDIAS